MDNPFHLLDEKLNRLRSIDDASDSNQCTLMTLLLTQGYDTAKLHFSGESLLKMVPCKTSLQNMKVNQDKLSSQPSSTRRYILDTEKRSCFVILPLK